jgi:predicted HTH domain antitoxin
MARITVDIPDDAMQAVCASPEKFGKSLRLAAAMFWYSRTEVSQEMAAMIAGLNRRDFLLALAEHKVDSFAVDFDDLQRELARG